MQSNKYINKKASGCNENHSHDGILKNLDKCPSEKIISRMALNDGKAGMEGLDKDKINKYVVGSLNNYVIYYL